MIGLQNYQAKGDIVPEGMQYEFEASQNNKLPTIEVQFDDSSDEQHINVQKEPIVEEQRISLNDEPIRPQQNHQLFGILLIREIQNPLNQKLSRRDTYNATNLILKMLAKEMNIDLKSQPFFISKDLQVEPILSSGILKASLILQVCAELLDHIIKNYSCIQQTLQDVEKKKIVREFTFNFYDLSQIKKMHSILQNGRFANEFLKVETGKNVTGKRTTQIIYAMHVRDCQLYAIKKVRLLSIPTWERVHFNQMQEIREIKAMLRLSHKNILRLFSWWFEEEYDDQKKRNVPFLFLQTEYLAYKDQSSDLLEFIFVNFEFCKLPIIIRRKKLFIIFDQVLDGIEYVHEQGFFHRDIKPENILVTENCWGEILIKICDFDFAKNLPDLDQPGSIIQSRITGTPGYTTNRSSKGSTYDIKEEIFMLGMVLLDLCKLYPEAVNRKAYHQDAIANKFKDNVDKDFPEEIQLFRMMTQQQQYSNIRELRESSEWNSLKEMVKR